MKQTNALPKLVASDIGGTLIRGSRGIPEFTAKVLNRLATMDIPVALITGYNYRTTLTYAANLDKRILLLPQNGTLCIKEGTLIWEHRIPETSAQEIYRYLEANDLPVILYKGKNEDFGNFYVHHEDVPALSYAFRRVMQLENFDNITGISTRLPDQMAQEVRQNIERIVGDAFTVIYVRESNGSWLEVVNNHVRKDLALKRLCQELNVSLSDAIYFGDNFNDREVLRIVGQPVLVENAMPEMKKEFKQVIQSVYDEGVARYLNELFELGVKG
jgi:Cof subfamily protein (haloacid dehalogenase superfamily)